MVKSFLILAIIANSVFLGESIFLSKIFEDGKKSESKESNVRQQLYPRSYITLGFSLGPSHPPVPSDPSIHILPRPKTFVPTVSTKPIEKPDKIDVQDVDSRLYTGILKLLNICLHQLNEENPHTNKMSTTVALYIKLCLCGLYSDDHIFNKIGGLLHMQNKIEMIYIINKLLAEFTYRSPSFSSELSFNFYTDVTQSVTYDFKNNFFKLVKGQCVPLDYSKPQNAAFQINAWASQNIQHEADIISPKSIPYSRNGFMLVSTWCLSLSFAEFKFVGRTEINYHNPEYVAKVFAWFGQGSGKYSYSEDIQAEIFEIPMENGFSMICIQPKDKIKYSITEILNKFKDPKLFTRVISQGKSVFLDLCMPLKEKYYRIDDYVKGLHLANELTELNSTSFNGFKNIYTSGQSGQASQLLHSIHFNIQGLPIGCDITPSPYATPKCPDGKIYKKITIDSGHLIYFMDVQRKPILAVVVNDCNS